MRLLPTFVRFPVLTSLSVFTVLFLTATTPFAQQIQGLGFDFAAAVSDDGRTVTGFMREGPAGDVTFTAVKWSEPGVVETLWSANSVSTASGVSADGAVVAGYRCTHTVEDPNVCEAFRHEDGQQTALPSDAINIVFDASADGAVIVGSYYETGTYTAARFEGGHAVHYAEGRALGVSADGAVVVGQRFLEDGTTRATVFSSGQEFGPGAAAAVSADGSTVVGALVEGGVSTAMRWHLPTGMAVPIVTGGSAEGVTGDGSVVVGAAYDPGLNAMVPFYWTEEEGYRTLEDVLTNDYGIDLGGWTLLSATDISADGAVIVGHGQPPSRPGARGGGAQQAYRVTLCGALAEWNAAAGGSFHDPENWLDLTAPGTTTTARFDYGDAYTVTFSESAENNRLEIADGVDVAFGLGANTHTLSGACADETVSVDGARLSVRAGTLHSQKAATVTGTETEPGELLVRSAGARLEVDSTLFVGREGHGLLRVEGTAEVVADAAYAGVEAGGSGMVEVEAGGRLLVESVLALASDAGSEATLLVTGEGSEVAVNFIGAIGGEGVATARVEQGGRLVFETADEAGFLLLGAAAEGEGTLTVEHGGAIEGDHLDIGVAGLGDVSVSDKGSLDVRQLTLGEEDGATGMLTIGRLGLVSVFDQARVGVRGEGVIFVVEGLLSPSGAPVFDLGVEPGGQGGLHIGFGSLAEAFAVTAGVRGTGELTVSDAGTLLYLGLLWVGGRSAGDGGTGTAAVTTGATLNVDVLLVGAGGTGTLTASDGGRIEVGTLYLYGGVLPQNDGGTIQAGSIIVEPAPTPRVDRRIEATRRGADGGTGVIQTDSLLVFGSGAVIEADAFEVRPGGVVGGTGPFPVGFVSAGTVAPADTASATATFAVAGDYAQTAEGVLEIELAGTAEGAHDRLVVAGTAALGGTLRLVRRPDYVPAVGDEYEVVSAPSVVGTFETVELPPDVALAVTYTETAVVATVTGVTVDAEAPAHPAAFALEAVYPNPFQSSARVAYALPEAADVRVVVYDVLGREVAVLVEGALAAGRHEAVLEAEALPSGIYLVRMTTNDGFAQVRQVTLVK